MTALQEKELATFFRLVQEGVSYLESRFRIAYDKALACFAIFVADFAAELA